MQGKNSGNTGGKQVKKLILFLALICLLPLVFAEHAFLVSFEYDSGSDIFSFDSVKIIDHKEIEFEEGAEEGYSLKLSSDKNAFEIKFKPVSIAFVDPPSDINMFDENGEQIYFPTMAETVQVQKKTQHSMLLPYMDNAKMEIFDEKNEKKLEVDLQEEIDKQIPDWVKESITQDEEKSEIAFNELVLYGIGILAIVLIVFLLIRKRKGKR